MSTPTRKHEHRYDRPWRGQRRCEWSSCRHHQYQVGPGEWRDAMTLERFAWKWLPAISGTRPEDMMTVKVAFPFEWNCYESWQTVYRVRFDFTDVMGRTSQGLGTRVDVMNGWQSKYAENFCRIDHEADAYYQERTGRAYDIGDNAYGAMREIIQAPIGAPVAPAPPTLSVVTADRGVSHKAAP